MNKQDLISNQATQSLHQQPNRQMHPQQMEFSPDHQQTTPLIQLDNQDQYEIIINQERRNAQQSIETRNQNIHEYAQVQPQQLQMLSPSIQLPQIPQEYQQLFKLQNAQKGLSIWGKIMVYGSYAFIVLNAILILVHIVSMFKSKSNTKTYYVNGQPQQYELPKQKSPMIQFLYIVGNLIFIAWALLAIRTYRPIVKESKYSGVLDNTLRLHTNSHRSQAIKKYKKQSIILIISSFVLLFLVLLVALRNGGPTKSNVPNPAQNQIPPYNQDQRSPPYPYQQPNGQYPPSYPNQSYSPNGQPYQPQRMDTTEEQEGEILINFEENLSSGFNDSLQADSSQHQHQSPHWNDNSNQQRGDNLDLKNKQPPPPPLGPNPDQKIPPQGAHDQTQQQSQAFHGQKHKNTVPNTEDDDDDERKYSPFNGLILCTLFLGLFSGFCLFAIEQTKTYSKIEDDYVQGTMPGNVFMTGLNRVGNNNMNQTPQNLINNNVV